MPSIKSKTEKTVVKEKAVKNESGSLESEKNTSPQPSPFKGEGEKSFLEMAVYNQDGQEVEKISLPSEIFGLKINNGLIKQAVEAQMSQARIPYAHAKDRSEVRGGGKKPWRQKGTGRARHGSIRSPIWIGGGVTHGPRKDKNFAKKINKQMRRKALLMVLSGKVRDNEILILDDLKLNAPKTKEMARVIKNLNSLKKDLGKGALIVMPAKDENLIRAARNIQKIDTIGVNSLNVVDLLSRKYLLMPKGAIEVIRETFSS